MTNAMRMDYFRFENYKEEKQTKEEIYEKRPFLTYMAMFVAVPAAMLLAVSAFTCAFVLPVAWLLGWM